MSRRTNLKSNKLKFTQPRYFAEKKIQEVNESEDEAIPEENEKTNGNATSIDIKQYDSRKLNNASRKLDRFKKRYSVVSQSMLIAKFINNLYKILI